MADDHTALEALVLEVLHEYELNEETMGALVHQCNGVVAGHSNQALFVHSLTSPELSSIDQAHSSELYARLQTFSTAAPQEIQSQGGDGQESWAGSSVTMSSAISAGSTGLTRRGDTRVVDTDVVDSIPTDDIESERRRVGRNSRNEDGNPPANTNHPPEINPEVPPIPADLPPVPEDDPPMLAGDPSQPQEPAQDNESGSTLRGEDISSVLEYSSSTNPP